MKLRSAIAVLALMALAPLPLNAADYRVDVKGADVPNHVMLRHLAIMLNAPNPQYPEFAADLLSREFGISDAEAQQLAAQIIEAVAAGRREKDKTTRRMLCSVYDHPSGDRIFDALTDLQDAKTAVSLAAYNSLLAKLPAAQSSTLSTWLEELKLSAAYRIVDHRTKWANPIDAELHIGRICNVLGMNYGDAQ